MRYFSLTTGVKLKAMTRWFSVLAFTDECDYTLFTITAVDPLKAGGSEVLFQSAL